MSRCRFRFEDLPEHVKAQVDAVLGKKAEAGSQRTEDGGREGLTGQRGPNKTEAAYRREVLGRRADVVGVHFEGVTFRMENGHRYTPDWLVVTTVGRIECHEVKGGYRLQSHQRARLAFDQARVEFPWVAWIWATRSKHGWEIGA